jgi:hypothetical protein
VVGVVEEDIEKQRLRSRFLGQVSFIWDVIDASWLNFIDPQPHVIPARSLKINSAVLIPAAPHFLAQPQVVVYFEGSLRKTAPPPLPHI